MREPESAPYVGPRPFERADEELFFGRDREANELLSLIVAHSVVVLYAQSGAGKTSLINAQLVPMLEKEGLDVLLPTARVQGRLAAGLDPDRWPKSNAYGMNALAGWLPDQPPAVLAEARLRMVLAPSQGVVDGSEEFPRAKVAVFDQFEELFTAYPERWRDREHFVLQLAESLEANRYLRVVLSLREDYIAELDPFAPLLPERLRTRYRLERLRREAALRAIEGPLKGTLLRLAPGVAGELVDSLLRVPRRGLGTAEVPGPFVEPVQLQVVCQTLWERVRHSGTEEITAEHLRLHGDVDRALQMFYERCIERVVAATGLNEGELRRWFERALLTPAGTRGMVFRDIEESGGIVNAAVDLLENQHLIRAELRGGERWYELSHDRFIAPIRESNRQWLLARATADATRRRLETKAMEWVRLGQSAHALLDGGEIAEADRWLNSVEASDVGISDNVRALVRASGAAYEAREEARRSELEHARRLTEVERGRAEAERERAAEQERRAEAERDYAAERARAARLRGRLLGALALLLVAVNVAGSYAYLQQRGRAQAERLAAHAAVREAGRRAVLEKALADQATAQLETERRSTAEIAAALSRLQRTQAQLDARRAEAERVNRILEQERRARELNLAGDRAGALQRYQEVLTLYRKAQDIAGIRETEANIAAIYLSLRRYDEAQQLYASVLRESAADPALRVNTLNNLANLMTLAGRREQARSYYERAIAESEAVSDRRQEANALTDFGYFLGQQDDVRAGSTLQRAVDLWHDLGDSEGEARALTNRGLLQLNQGRFDEARRDIARAQELRQLESGIRSNPVQKK